MDGLSEQARGWELDFFGQPEKFQQPDGQIGGVELPPPKPVTGGGGKSVVIIVPAFAATEQGHPPKIGGAVIRLVGPVAPNVGRGIDEPGRVINKYGPNNHSPDHEGQSAPGVKADRQEDRPKDEGLVQESVDTVLREVRCKTQILLGVIDHFILMKNPTHVGPKKSFGGAMRIAFVVGIGVMKAVRGDPFDRPTLTGQTADERQEILQRFGDFETAVSEQTVIAQSDSKAGRDPIKNQAQGQGGPIEGKEGGDRGQVESHDEKKRPPGNLLILIGGRHRDTGLLIPGLFEIIRFRERRFEGLWAHFYGNFIGTILQ